MFGRKQECFPCKKKEEFIDQLMADHRDCKSCKSLQGVVDYLKAQIDQLHASWESERCEYKRTTDRLLELSGSRPVGQGPTPKPMPSMPLEKMMGIFDEEEERLV